MFARRFRAALPARLLVMAILVLGLVGGPGAATVHATSTTATDIFNNWNGDGLAGGTSAASPQFVIGSSRLIRMIHDYHNALRGQPCTTTGTIALQLQGGSTYGPWSVTCRPGDDGAAWQALPDAVIPAGTYTVIDSDASSWSYNSGSSYDGMSEVQGWDDQSWSTTTPIIDLQPSSASVLSGDNACFTAFEDYYPVPAVQWQVSSTNGESWTTATGAGATSDSYCFTAAPTDNGHLYRAEFTNSSQTNPTMDSDSALLTIGPALTVSESQDSDFYQGDSGDSLSIDVENTGTDPTDGTQVSVVATLDSGLTATALSGTNWTCTLATLTCTRSDVLAVSSSYDTITLTVDVASDASSSQAYGATVAGGGDATGSSYSDSATIEPDYPRLSLGMSHTGNFQQGDIGDTYSITVTNTSGPATTSEVDVYPDLDSGLTATDLSGPGWSCDVQSLTCTRNDALAPGASYPITLTVDVASDAYSPQVPDVRLYSYDMPEGQQPPLVPDSTIILMPTSTAIDSAMPAGHPPVGTSVTFTALVQNIGTWNPGGDTPSARLSQLHPSGAAIGDSVGVGPFGAVTFTADGNDIAGCVDLSPTTTPCSTTSLTAGSHAIVAHYSDASNTYGPSDSAPLNYALTSVLTLSPSTLPDGTVGSPYSVAITASGGNSHYTYALAQDTSLPPGLTLDSDGTLHGTPTDRSGSPYSVSIVASETSTDYPGTGSRTYSLAIDAPAPPYVPLTATATATPQPTSTSTPPPTATVTAIPTATSTQAPVTATSTGTPWVIIGTPGMAAVLNGSTQIMLRTDSDAVAPGQSFVLTAALESYGAKLTNRVAFMDGGEVVATSALQAIDCKNVVDQRDLPAYAPYMPSNCYTTQVSLMEHVIGLHYLTAAYPGAHGAIVVSTTPIVLTVGSVSTPLSMANYRHTVIGGRAATYVCDPHKSTVSPYQDGCELVVADWAPAGKLTYTLSYDDGTTQTWTDSNSTGHSQHVFLVTYKPSTGAKHGQPVTIGWISVVAVSKDGTQAKSACLRFAILAPATGKK